MKSALAKTAPIKAHPASTVDRATVLTKATMRAADLLGLTQAGLAAAVGASEATVSRWSSGSRTLAEGSKEAELAALVVRIYRSLDALVGNDDAKRRAWMEAPHRVLHGVPRELVRTPQGMVRVLDYLDGMRAPI
jgi:putative toxin-antitoxin system antitoxin component (TIGR02293 family)